MLKLCYVEALHLIYFKWLKCNTFMHVTYSRCDLVIQDVISITDRHIGVCSWLTSLLKYMMCLIITPALMF